MSKKTASSKGKKLEKNKSLTNNPQPWIDELNSIIINDESWFCNVNMIVEDNPYNTPYMIAAENMFGNEHTRPHIKIISNSSLAVKLLEMSYNINISTATNGYKKLCEAAVKYCFPNGFSEDIPIEMLASIIKYYIYELKLKNLEEKRIINTYLQNKNKMRNASLLLVQNTGKGVTSSKDNRSKKDVKSTTSKKAGKEKNQETKFTELRKRGEEILDTITQQTDEPVDGPHLHIILNSFRQAQLPLELLKLKVPLTSLVKLYNFSKPDQNNMINESESNVICTGLGLIPQGKIFKERRFSNNVKEILLSRKNLHSFWNQFYKILSNKSNVLLFKDTIFLKFYPKLYYHLPLDEFTLSISVYQMIQKSFYNQLCHLQYDIQDVKRQHENFINHLIDRKIECNVLYDFNKMNVYKSALEEIPPEILNIPFILDCIIQQVVYLVDQTIPTSSSKPLNVDQVKVNENVTKSINGQNEADKYLKMKLTELDIKHDLFQGENIIEEVTRDIITGNNLLPIVLVYGDEIGIKSHWWDKEKRIKNITCNLLRCFWDKLITQRLHFYDELSDTKFVKDRDLFLLLKNTGNITIRDKLCKIPCVFDVNYFIVEDKAYVFCLHSDIDNDDDNIVSEKSSNLYHCNDLDSNTLLHYEKPSEGHYLGQIYDTHSYCFEEMTSDIMLQCLLDSLETFNCIDFQQDCFMNKLFIKFHHKKTCCKEEYLVGTLKTKTALRDFYDYSIDEEFYWLNEQELAYDKVQKKKENDRLMTALNKLQYLKNREIFRTSKICSEINFVMHNTVKQTEAGQLTLPSITSLIEEIPKSKNDSVFIEPYHLESFDIDLPNRIQFSERRQHFIISLNSQLLIKVLSKLYENDALSLKSTIHGHSLYFHHGVGNIISTNFHLIHSSGMIFYFKKNTINNNLLKKQENVKQNNATSETNMPQSIEESDIFLKPLLYQLQFSLPNSLCFELINPNNISLYIKQYYLNKVSVPKELQNEKFRCYLTNGTVIKFMTDETIVIYYPYGEIFKCEILPLIDENVYLPTEIAQKLNETKQSKKHSSKIKTMLQKGESSSTLPETLSQGNPVKITSYDYTSVEGRRFTVKEGFTVEHESLFCKSFTDVFNGVIVTERSDGTIMTHNKEGTLFIDYPDGSRITTTASFAAKEICFGTCEDESEDEENENMVDVFLNKNLNLDQESDITLQLLDESEESSSEQHISNFRHKSEGFTVINTQYYFENLNFTSVFIDLNKEEVNVYLPCNVDISFTSEGLYTINFDQKAEFITEYDKLIFRELKNKNLPEFTINLAAADHNNFSQENANKTDINLKNEVENSQKRNNTVNKPEVTSHETGSITNHGLPKADHESKKQLHYLFSCVDEYGNQLTIDNDARIDINLCNGTLCKCDKIEKYRMFVLDTNYDGFEVFPPEFWDLTDTETNYVENSVRQSYGSLDHQTMIILKPLLQNEREKWLMPLKKIRYLPLYELPSTYNDEKTTYNPFPKIKPKEKAKVVPHVMLMRAINRANCNIHLQEETFIQNKKVADLLRLKKCSELAIELFERGSIPFCKADKTFIEYIKRKVIGSMIEMVRRRVVKRLEMKKIREYTHILVNRLLLPYFDSAQGSVFIILFDLILKTVKLCTDDRNKLEKLLCAPLHQLEDEDLDYIHYTIAPLTVSNFCNCNESIEFCQLRILLLAGRALSNYFPDMISVFYSYGSNVKKTREAERKKRETEELKLLLNKPSEELSENDLVILHDILRTLPIIPFCSCIDSPLHCKLRMILISCVILNFMFPNLNSLLKLFKIEINCS